MFWLKTPKRYKRLKSYISARLDKVNRRVGDATMKTFEDMKACRNQRRMWGPALPRDYLMFFWQMADVGLAYFWAGMAVGGTKQNLTKVNRSKSVLSVYGGNYTNLPTFHYERFCCLATKAHAEAMLLVLASIIGKGRR